MQVEHLNPEFNAALALGKHNEQVIAHEFSYQGIPVKPTEGKHPFDFFLPDGRSVEVKIDVRSQCTGYAAVELPTLSRRADIYIYTLTYARVLTFEQLRDLYQHEGKLPWGGIGDLGYDARLVKNLGKQGVPLYQFIRDLNTSSN